MGQVLYGRAHSGEECGAEKSPDHKPHFECGETRQSVGSPDTSWRLQ